MLGINSKLQLKLDIIAKVDKGKISIINASKLLKTILYPLTLPPHHNTPLKTS